MLNVNEQLILLHLLKRQNISQKSQKIIKSFRFYTMMKKMEEKDLVFSNYNSSTKIWKLTKFGELVANCLAKLPSTPKEYQNHKTDIRWFFE
jgi:hypothetical protein